jgi:Flp pilus assembly protein TadG
VTKQSGNTSILFAVCLVLILGAAGLGVDYAIWSEQRTDLQDSADAAALAGAVELGLGGNRAEERARERSLSFGASQLTQRNEAATPTIIVDSANETVSVSYAVAGRRSLSALLLQRDPTINVTAVAAIASKDTACIFALNPTATKALNGNGNAILQGTNCGIQVNSSASDAMVNSGTISASSICVVGNYGGSGYTPQPNAGCPVVPDPFAATPIPTPGVCDATNLSINASQTFSAPMDVFCGGLSVSSGATATFQPGVYHIVDGPLKVTAGGSIVGNEVVFVLSGTATMDIAGQGRVSATPPLSGDLAGYSIVQSRTAPLGGANKITGEGQFSFPGIMYLPRSSLDIAGRADGNTFTPTYAAIVADTIKISGQGELRATASTANLTKKDSQKLTVINVRLSE